MDPPTTTSQKMTTRTTTNSQRPPGRSPPTNSELQESTVSLLRTELHLIKQQRDTLQLQVEKFKTNMQSDTDDTDSFMSPRISRRHTNYPDYDSLKVQCERNISELTILRLNIVTETANNLKSAMKECDYHRNRHQNALQTTNQLQHDIYDLRSRLIVVKTEKEQLEQEVRSIQLTTEMERRELKLYRTKRAFDPESRSDLAEDREFLQSELDTLNSKYMENLNDLSTALQRAESSDREHLRLSKVAEDAINSKNAAIAEREEYKHQAAASEKRSAVSRREQSTAKEQINKLREELDQLRLLHDSEKVKRQRVMRDLVQVTDERNVAQAEYRLVMSERDTVLRETQKVQDDLNAAREQIAAAANQTKGVNTETESLRREIASALQDRDQALKDLHEFKEQSASAEAEPQRESEVERFTAEMAQMQLLVDNMKQEVADAQREIAVVTGQRAFMLQKRDDAVREMESGRRHNDTVRRERDKALRDLAEALQENDELKRQRLVALTECQDLREKLERSRDNRPRQLHSGRHNESRDSAIDADFATDMLSETLEIDLNADPSMLGFDLSGGIDDPTCPTNLFVSSVMKGSPAEGKLQVSDFLLRINDVDLAHADRDTALQALHSSSGTINMLIRRRRTLKITSKSIPVYISIPLSVDSGLSLSKGLYVSRLSPSSPLSEAGLCVGDRITHLAGASMDERSPEEVHHMLKGFENQYENRTVALNVVRYYASSPILDNSFDSSDSGKASQGMPFPYANPRSPVNRLRMISSSVQTDEDLERNDSTVRLKRPSESRGKSPRKSIFDLFPNEISNTQSVTKTTRSSSTGKEPRGTMKDRFLDRLLRRDKKPEHRPTIKLIPNSANHMSDETRVIQEFESVLEQHQSKHGTRTSTTSKVENISSGTWPKYKGAPLELMNDDDQSRPSPKKLDRKSARSLTMSSRQVPFPTWGYRDIPLDDEGVVPSPTPSTNTLKAQKKSHRLSGPPVYDTLRSSAAVPEPIYPTLQRKKSANVDTSDSSSISSSLDFTDGRRFPRNEAHPLQSLNKRPYLEYSPPTGDYNRADMPFGGVTLRNPSIATNGTLRGNRDFLRNEPCSPMSMSREESRHYGSPHYANIYNDPKRPVTLTLPASHYWPSGDSVPSHPGSRLYNPPPNATDFSKYSNDRLSSASGSVARIGHNSPMLPASPLDRNPPPLYQTIKRRPQIGQVRTVRLDCFSDQPGNPGFRIGAIDDKIYVFSVIESSIADRNGLFVGDQIIDVCGINLRNSTYEQAVKIFKNAGSVLILQVQYKGPLPAAAMGSSSSFQSPLSSSVATSSDSVGPNGTLKNSQMREFTGRREKCEQARFVKLTKGLTDPPGINLIGGNVHGIFIHFVQPGSAAARCNELSCGDQILEYNGVNMRALLLEKAMFELCKPVTNVSMIVQYHPDKFELAKSSPGDALFVKTLWDRDKSQLHDEELMFHKGDILFVDNTLYNGEIGSWRAHLLNPTADAMDCGIIPNRYKAEEECLGLQQANFDLVDSLDPKRRTSARRSLFKRRKVKQTGTELASFSDSSLLGSDNFSVAPVEPNIPTYVRVDKVVYEERRPVLLCGPFSEMIVDRLLHSKPDLYSRCPVFTSADPPANDDVDTIESRPSSGYWETVTTKSVREIIQKDMHCFLDVNIASIERLHAANISPIVLLISFRSSSAIREVRDNVFNSSKLSQKAAKELFDSAGRIEAEYGKMITATVAGGTSLPFMVTAVAAAIQAAQEKPEWISLGPVI